ncbi:MAG: 3-hydroxyacyl-CoA dehydrogenase family protein [Gemmatimonadales bacterium]
MKRIAVIGAGTMGHGIAQVAAQAGCTVRMTDARTEVLPHVLDRIRANLAGGVTRGKLAQADADATIARLSTSATVAHAVADADIVIEAVVENLNLKRDLFRELHNTAPTAATLATNTSSLSVATIADGSDRVVGMHFFNPVHIMKLVEVVRPEGAAESHVTVVVDLARQMGKEPIIVRDTPGFASSRLGVVLGLEAMRMVEQGVASPKDIDTAMELGYGHPMGPLKVTDLVGLDVRLAIAEYLHRALGDPRYAPPAILKAKVAAGELGKKTGKGFYEWPTTSSS